MQWYEPEVRELEDHLRTGPVPQRPAVFYGSSSIRMWSDLAEDLGDERALNLGFGGSTLAACVHFFERLVPRVNPSSLVVYAGDNDLGDGRSSEEVLGSFCRLANLVGKDLDSIPFGFISIKLSPARIGLREIIRRTNRVIRQEIALRPGAYYINIFDAMLDAKGQPRREFFLEDGLHLSRQGYRLWARLLEPYRNRIFTPPSPEVGTERISSTTDEP